MDTTTTLVLTILANAIVTGIIVYVFQKRIENSFARSMEEFKAEIQLSVFEQQIKFTRNYEKMVDTLETLCRHYGDFAESLQNQIGEAGKFYSHPRKKGNPLDNLDLSHAFDKLDVFWRYFETNRFYLPNEIVKEISNVYHNSFTILGLVAFALVADNTHPHGQKNFVAVNSGISSSKLRITNVSSETPNIKLFLDETKEEVNDRVQHLEDLYKSVADIKAIKDINL